jgi:hypothetical protein
VLARHHEVLCRMLVASLTARAAWANPGDVSMPGKATRR